MTEQQDQATSTGDGGHGTPPARPERDRPWVMRTYAGHSSASESNALYRRNLAKGQTGLSVAFDLPTQTGYDPDSVARPGEVGKVGVPIPHVDDMRQLFDDIPLTEMNTSMTINATAMWLLALYQVVAEEQSPDVDPREVTPSWPAPRRTTSSRSTSPAGPTSSRPSTRLRLTTDIIAYTVNHMPEVEPDQHLQLPPAGGRSDADPGAGLRALHGHRGPGLGA